MSGKVFHGGGLDAAIAAHGGRREDWLDLSTGINPRSYPVSDLPESIWKCLPDRAAETALKDAAKRYYKVAANSHLIAANGTQTLIELLPKVMKCERVAVVGPTYEEHAQGWRKAGTHVDVISRNAPLPLLCNALVTVNPNNPDGKCHSVDELKQLSRQIARQHGYLVVDEAFGDADPELSLIAERPENTLIYRSFGKFFGLAGLRLGFLVGPVDVVHQLENLLGPWSVSGPALELGRRAMEDVDWIDDTRKWLKQRSALQAQRLEAAGLVVEGVNPLFIYVSHEKAKQIHDGLADKHILVRPFPDCPDKMRFGICKDDQDFQRLVNALDAVMGKA